MSSRPGDASGAGASARLLLALTALYGQRSNHGADEQRQFTALALGLIDRAGAAACATALARLRDHPDVPAQVMERLGEAAAVGADADVKAADAQSADVKVADVKAADVEVAGAQAAEPQVAEPQGAEPQGAEPQVAGAQVAGAQAAEPQADASRGDDVHPGEVPDDPADADGGGPAGSPPRSGGEAADGARRPLTPEFGGAFLAAAPAGRRAMLAAVAAARGAAAASPHDGVQVRIDVRIDVSPWRGRTGAFARDFARLIDAPQPLAERILNDPSGEPLVIAARATGMALAVLQRILLLASPAPHPVARVWDLSELYHAVDAGTARELLAAWRMLARPEDGRAADGCSDHADQPGRAAAAVDSGAPSPDLRARLRALSARIEGATVISRSGPGNAGRHDPPSR